MSLLLNMKKLEKCFIVLSHTFQTQYLPKIFKRIKRQTKPSHYLVFFFLVEQNGKGITIKVLDYYNLQYFNFPKDCNTRFHHILSILSFICWKFIMGSEA